MQDETYVQGETSKALDEAMQDTAGWARTNRGWAMENLGGGGHMECFSEGKDVVMTYDGNGVSISAKGLDLSHAQKNFQVEFAKSLNLSSENAQEAGVSVPTMR